MKKAIGLLMVFLLVTGCGDQDLLGGESDTSRKGQERGNGGDLIPSEDLSSWFVGENSTITYCLEISKDFGVGEKRALEAIETAFETWKDYIETKDINVGRQTATMMSVKRERLSSCDGTQQVTFYLGVTNDLVRIGAKNFYKPVAFAMRTSFDAESGKGKGFIWLAKMGSINIDCNPEFPECKGFPNWQTKYNLEGMLIHEIGHTYGNPHVARTIMDQSFARRLINITDEINDKYRFQEMMQVDQLKELVICEFCEQEYLGALGLQYLIKRTFKDPDTGEVITEEIRVDKSEEAFEDTLGRRNNGEIEASVFLNREGQFILRLSDSISINELLVSFPPGDTGSVTEGPMVFKTSTGRFVDWESIGSTQKFGELTRPDGSVMHLSVHRNMFTTFDPPGGDPLGRSGPFIFDSRLIIYYFTDEGQKVLFMNLPEEDLDEFGIDYHAH